MRCGLSKADPADGTSTVGVAGSVRVALARCRPLPARPTVEPLRSKRLLALPDLLAAFAKPLAEEPLAAAESARLRPLDFPWANKAGVLMAERPRMITAVVVARITAIRRTPAKWKDCRRGLISRA